MREFRDFLYVCVFFLAIFAVYLVYVIIRAIVLFITAYWWIFALGGLSVCLGLLIRKQVQLEAQRQAAANRRRLAHVNLLLSILDDAARPSEKEKLVLSLSQKPNASDTFLDNLQQIRLQGMSERAQRWQSKITQYRSEFSPMMDALFIYPEDFDEDVEDAHHYLDNEKHALEQAISAYDASNHTTRHIHMNNHK